MRGLTAATRTPLIALALAVGLLAAGGPRAWSGPTGATAANPGFVVLLDGLCSTLSTGQTIPGNFAGDGGIHDRLVASGWSADTIVAYSYRGGSVDATGDWHPLSYDCAQSRDQSLARDAELLDAQLTALSVAHPGAVFHLVGFSLGGLVAFGELVRLANFDSWQIAGGGRVGSVTTLDLPLGGVPFVDEVCAFAPDECGGSPNPGPGSVLRSMSAVWSSGTGAPAGGTRSVAAVLPTPVATAGISRSLARSLLPEASMVLPRRNQSLALTAAADHSVEVLTIGNVRDWLYAPFGPSPGKYTFLDTQWLTSSAASSGLYARAIDSGPAACPTDQGGLAASYSCNHGLVTRDAAVGQAILDALGGRTPALAKSCPAGKGGCLSLPPRPAVAIGSSIAGGIVTTGGHFTTSAVAVAAGARATVLFATNPSLPLAKIEIWARSAGGVYHFLTSRIADATGAVRYYTPPVSRWTAYQARYPGDFTRGAGVSPGRVVTVR